MTLPFKLLLITDWSRPDCVARVRDALRAGPGIAIQHRHPGATDRQFFEEGLRLKDACGTAPLFVNGRLDVALALEAHLHLTEWSLGPGDVRPHLGERWVSASWHSSVSLSLRSGERAGVRGPRRTTVAPHLSSPRFAGRGTLLTRGGRQPVAGVDLLLVSPVFDPLSKPRERPPLGPEGFHQLAGATPVTCFALGGITAARVPGLRPVAGVAVIGEVMHAASPAHAAEALLRALE